MHSQPSRSDILPGCEARVKEALQRRANAPLKPSKPQQPMEAGLFGDGHQQRDMFDEMLRDFFQPPKRKGEIF